MEKGGKRRKIFLTIIISVLSLAIVVGVLYGLVGVRFVSTCTKYEEVHPDDLYTTGPVCLREERVMVFAYVSSRSCAERHGYDAVIYSNPADGNRGGYLGCRWL